MSRPVTGPPGEQPPRPPLPAAVQDLDRLARAHLSRVVEPGDAALSGEVAEYGWEGVAGRLHAGQGPQRWRARHGALTTSTVALLSSVARMGISVITPADPSWPPGLDDLDLADLGPVACLWVRGRLPQPSVTTLRNAPTGAVRPDIDGSPPTVPGRSVAIVGARACSGYGQHIATELACDLASRGWTVVSGAAYGIDAAAHRGALTGGVEDDAGTTTGRHVATVAVLACGVDRTYPAGHLGLIDRIIATGGAVVSELPPGAAPQRWRFLQRNRVIAAMGAATVVVEAAARSGAAGTARAAAAIGRPVGAVPGSVAAATSSGCHELIRDGVATLVRGCADVIELASPIGAGLDAQLPADPGARPGAGLLTERVLACLSPAHGTGTAQVALVAGLDVARAREVLLDLELAAGVIRSDGGWLRPR